MFARVWAVGEADVGVSCAERVRPAGMADRLMMLIVFMESQ
jgi:hypothetical protein